MGAVSINRVSGLNNGGFTVSGVGDAVNNDDAVNFGQMKSAISGLAFANVSVSGDGNIVTTQNGSDVTLALSPDITVDSVTADTVNAGGNTLDANGLTVGSVTISNTGLDNGGNTVTSVGNAVNADDAVNLGQLSDVDDRLTAENVQQNIVIDSKADTTYVDASDANLQSQIDTKVENSVFVADQDRQDAITATKADTTYVDSENAAQNIVINSKADTTYVDAADANLQTQIDTKVEQSDFIADQQRQDDALKAESDRLDAADANLQVQVDNKVDNSVFVASQEQQNDNLKAETDRLDAADADLQVQVNSKVENSVFVADQARQDAASKAESDRLDAADTNLQVQVDEKVDTETFVADQARQDAITKEKADITYVDSENVAQVAVFNKQISDMQSVSNAKLDEIVTQQSMIDTSQDIRISNNSNLISDLGYKVDNLEDKLSAGVASSIAFASLPDAINKGEVRIAGGTGYFNGQGAIAVGITGATETGSFTYKMGGSYTQTGGAVLGGGVSYRVW